MREQEKVNILMDKIDGSIIFPDDQRKVVQAAVIDGLLTIRQQEIYEHGSRVQVEEVPEGFGYWGQCRQLTGIGYGIGKLAAGRDGRPLKVLKKVKNKGNTDMLFLIYPGCYIAEATYDKGREQMELYKVKGFKHYGDRYLAACERLYSQAGGSRFCNMDDREIEMTTDLMDSVKGLAGVGKAPGWPV